MKHKKEKKSQDFKLNITAIIDCMVILISYTLVSASFIAMGAVDINFYNNQPPPPSTQNQKSSPPEVNVTVNLRSQRELDIIITGKIEKKFRIPAKDSEWDLDMLAKRLDQIKTKFKDIKVITITAQDSIQYREVVGAIEAAQKKFPGIWLGEQT